MTEFKSVKFGRKIYACVKFCESFCVVKNIRRADRNFYALLFASKKRAFEPRLDALLPHNGYKFKQMEIRCSLIFYAFR